MAIENINEIQTYLTTNAEVPEVKTYLDSFKVQPTLEVFKSKLNDADFKSFIDSEKDKHSSKSLETWKTNNLSKLIDDKVKELYPQADPKDTELAKLKQQLDQMQKETTRKDLTNKALKIAQEKKLPSDLIDYFIGQDEETTTKNLEALEKVFNAQVQKAVETRLPNGYKPPLGDKTNTTLTKEQFNKLGYQERMKLFNDNPELYKELSK